MSEKKKEQLDTKYIIELQRGNKDAFNEVYTFYKNHIYLIGISFFSNEEKAKDLVQSVFLEIYQSIKKLKDPIKFYTWMNRIAYSRCLLMIRYDMKDSLHYTSDMGENYTDDSIEDTKYEDIITILQKEQVKQIVMETLETMSPEQRTICYLRLFENLSWPEISNIMDIPVGTLSSTMARTKPKLKEALEKKGFKGTHCLGILMLPNILQYFKAFLDTKKQLSLTDSNHISEIILKSNIGVGGFMFASSNKLLYVCLGGFLLGSGFLIGNKMFATNTEKEYAVIEKVTHPSTLTNEPFVVDVITSNNNYDEIQMNGKNDLKVDQNGTYTIALVKDKKEIDQKTIQISNIDYEMPIITKQLYQNETMIICVDDIGSQVDFQHIKFYENGVSSNQFRYDADKKEIYIDKGVAEDNIIEVPDTLGNVMQVKVVFYEFSR